MEKPCITRIGWAVPHQGPPRGDKNECDVPPVGVLEGEQQGSEGEAVEAHRQAAVGGHRHAFSHRVAAEAAGLRGGTQRRDDDCEKMGDILPIAQPLDVRGSISGMQEGLWSGLCEARTWHTLPALPRM